MKKLVLSFLFVAGLSMACTANPDPNSIACTQNTATCDSKGNCYVTIGSSPQDNTVYTGTGTGSNSNTTVIIWWFATLPISAPMTGDTQP